MSSLLPPSGSGDQGDQGFDISQLFEQAEAMQEALLAAQTHAASVEVEGVSGGGAVKIVCTGGMEFRRVTISPELATADDVPLMEDLVLAAIRDAISKAADVNEQALGGIAGFGEANA
jgi:hypothetical protein